LILKTLYFKKIQEESMKMALKKFLFSAAAFLWLALPARALELGEHPRLYVTGQGNGKVPGVAQLRRRIAMPEYAKAWQRLKDSNAPHEIALVYLLTGDTTRISRVREALAETTGRSDQVVERSLAFDWAYSALNEQERKEFAARLMDSSEQLARRYRIPTAYHNYCRNRHMGQGFAMLGAWGDDPRAEKLMPQVEKELQEFLEILGDNCPVDDMTGRAGYGGGWPEGYDYDRHGALYAIQLLLAWRSAGLGDHITGSSYWLDKVLWLLYGTGPDGSFVLGYEDNDWPFVMPHDRQMMTILEGELGSGLASWWIDTFADTLRIPAYWEFLFSDPKVKNIPPERLPTSRLIPGVGLALMRSSWQRDATFVHFHCGPWYTYHQHAAQGSFTAWRGRPLLIEPGVYDGEVTEHYVNWRIRSISHNCILVMDSSERFLGPNDVPVPANDGGQIIQNWTLKPANLAEWRAQRKMRDTGQITAFLTDTSHDFVSGEAAGAYNPEKVQRWCRQLLFIKPDWIVVSDYVVAASADFPKTLMFHTPDRIAAANGVAETVVDQGSPLKAFSLLPEGAELGVAGGPGKTFTYGGKDWTGPDPYNEQYGVAWRLEIGAPAQRAATFLTAIYLPPVGAGEKQPPQAELVESNGEKVSISLDGGKYRVALDPQAEKTYRISGSGITYSVSGAVLENSLPIEGAFVELVGAKNKRAKTDHWGRYLFQNLPPAEYRVLLPGTKLFRDIRITDHNLGEVNLE
jgi:hypothetical protein